ncbi:MAG: LptF/LptG family permease, partial [Candidatus Omnitrophota bacterium]
DNEVIALRASGVSLYKVALPVVICGFIISLLCVPLNDKILPQSEFVARKLLKQLGIKHPAALLEPGVFVKGFKDYVIFIHGIDGNKLENIRIYQPRKDGPTRTIVANNGEIIPMPNKNSVKLKLNDGTADEIVPENPDEFYKLSFQEYYMTLNLDKAVDVQNIQKKAREKNIRELLSDMHSLEKDDINVIPLRIELHKKLALAFSNLIFILVGIPLAITTHRREKFIGFSMAMGIFLLYWAIMLGGIAFAIRAIVPPWVGVWSANILLACLALFLFMRVAKK